MRIAICEDRPDDRALLRELVESYLRTGGFEAEIEEFSTGEAMMNAFSAGKYQIILQDIYLEKSGADGMKVIKAIREADSEVSVIFTTISNEHASLSYQVDAAYYIVKPVSKDMLAAAMNKCRAQLERHAKTVLLTINRQPVKIRLRDIYYAEIRDHCIMLHMASGTTSVRMALRELLKKLGCSAAEGSIEFVLCHRSYIVNLINAAEMRDGCFFMKNGDTVPISRKHAPQAQAAFKRMFFQGESGAKGRANL